MQICAIAEGSVEELCWFLRGSGGSCSFWIDRLCGGSGGYDGQGYSGVRAMVIEGRKVGEKLKEKRGWVGSFVGM